MPNFDQTNFHWFETRHLFDLQVEALNFWRLNINLDAGNDLEKALTWKNPKVSQRNPSNLHDLLNLQA